ncbi:MAG: hypothetical protein WKF84_17220 [Pyrinomonadaceae bacterium]
MADELFFTGTAAEVSPIRSVDRITVGAGKRGPVSKRIQDTFFEITSGARPAPGNWLTFVVDSIEGSEGSEEAPALVEDFTTVMTE